MLKDTKARIGDSKIAWAGGIVALLGAAAPFVPDANVVLGALGLPQGPAAITLGLGLIFGRDTVQRFLEALRK